MKSTGSFNDVTEVDTFPKSFAWDWPFCDDGIARGMYTEEKFFVCLPFHGGTGEKSGTTRKFEKISESNFSWTIGLSNSSNEFSGASFWRMEIETLRSLNMLALIVSRDISYEGPKRLKRVRKVYRLPQMYDITTLRSTSYDWAIVIEALRRRDVRTNKPIALKRADTLA
uniref:MATH domain-containing protein n=1 Tax=Panagrellus redivivus TaxID=6233 RepID=A0A7E4W796_PANRE